MSNDKEFVSYSIALELKQLGFDEPCFGYYNTTWSKQNELLFPQYAGELENWNEMIHLCSAPTFSQTFRWFREKYKKVDYPEFDYDEQKWHCHSDYKGYVLFDTYEEAELACLIKLIDIVKSKKD